MPLPDKHDRELAAKRQADAQKAKNLEASPDVKPDDRTADLLQRAKDKRAGKPVSAAPRRERTVPKSSKK